jgi:hypothetical protein
VISSSKTPRSNIIGVSTQILDYFLGGLRHHVGAVSFDAILKNAKAKFVLGLTATPVCRDGLQPIIFMQCGPIRYKVAKPGGMPHDLEVLPRSRLTRINLPTDAGIQDVFRHLANDRARTDAIAAEVRDAVG